MREFTVDGTRFSTLSEAADEFTRVLGFTEAWRGNLDAFNDFLHGGFGTPDDGFVIVWLHSEVSREHLGYAATVSWLEERARDCHPQNAQSFQRQLGEARKGKGSTLFEMLVEIIHDHDDITLKLA